MVNLSLDLLGETWAILNPHIDSLLNGDLQIRADLRSDSGQKIAVAYLHTSNAGWTYDGSPVCPVMQNALNRVARMLPKMVPATATRH
jgi:hypothetical protein